MFKKMLLVLGMSFLGIASVRPVGAEGMLTPPKKPANFSVFVDSISASAYWFSSAGARAYKLTRNDTGESIALLGDQNFYRFSGPFDPSKRYQFTLAAMNAAGESEPYVFTWIEPQVDPHAPVTVTYSVVNMTNHSLYGYLELNTVQAHPSVRYDVDALGATAGTFAVDPSVTYEGYHLFTNPRDVVGYPGTTCFGDVNSLLAPGTYMTISITANSAGDKLACKFTVKN